MSKILIFPTDTVYGIGAKISDVDSQRKIFEIKKRELNKRLAVLCFDVNDINNIAYLNRDAEKLISHFMPGALTIILKTKEKYINELIKDTIAVRIPNHPVALEILKENGPMATTSVNLSSEPPINDYEIINDKYSSLVDCIYKNNKEIEGISSTIVDLSSDAITLIREGSIAFSSIKKYLMNN